MCDELLRLAGQPNFLNLLDDDTLLNEIAECVGRLRNDCVQWIRFDEECSSVIGTTTAVVGKLLEDLVCDQRNLTDEQKECRLLIARRAVQFLTNSCNKWSHVAELIWKSGGILFLEILMLSEDHKLIGYTSALTASLLSTLGVIDSINESLAIIDPVLNRSLDCSWCLQLIEKLLAVDDQFMVRCWTRVDGDRRDVLLQIAECSLKDQSTFVSEPNCVFVASMFSKEIDRAIAAEAAEQFCSSIQSIRSLLKFLCEATAFENRCKSIRRDQHLLANILRLLSDVQHRFPMETANSMETGVDEDEERQRLYGFQRDLVRLIANVTYGRPIDCRDHATDLNALTVLFNCTKIDTRNPYVTEWSVFAIRNLLKNSPENQAIVRSLRADNLIVDDSVLERYGLQVSLNNDTGRIELKRSTA